MHARNLAAPLSLVCALASGCYSPNNAADAETGGEGGSSQGETGSGGTTTATTATTNPSDPTAASESTSSSAGTSVSTDDSGTSGPPPPSCGDSGQCVPYAEAGWNGPVAVVTAPAELPAPACPAGFPRAEVLLGASLTVAASSCECACTAEGVTCDEATELQVWDNAGCVGGPAMAVIVDDDGCVSLTGNIPPELSDEDFASNPLANDWWGMAPVGLAGGTCVADLSEQLGNAEFETQVTACGGAASDPCVDGLCVPDDADRVCVWQDGEHECPAGYPEHSLAYQDQSDTRACTACDCGSVQGTCDASIALRENDNGCDAPIGTIEARDCAGTIYDIEYATLTVGSPITSCDGDGTTALSGEAVAVGPVTICCY